jgi:hypothetical protein
MIARTLDAGFLDSVANDAAVRPTLAGTGAIDLTGVVEDPANFALVADCGGFLLTPVSPGHYEVHSMFLPGNGSAPIKAMRAAQEWMFTRTDCVSVWSKVPVSNRAAKGFAIAGGLQPCFERDYQGLGQTEFVELPILRWAMSCKALEAHGERFHACLEAAKANTGSPLPTHPHDPAHERAVGAALLMFERGQPHKGAAFYNLWANVAGYAPLRLLGVSPVTVDAGDAIVGLGPDGLEILKCR